MRLIKNDSNKVQEASHKQGRLPLVTCILGLSLLCASAYAADEAKPANVPPPPPLDPSDPADTGSPVDEPQITIIKKPEQTIEEYRIGGRLYMIKVTPKHGKPYYLVDDRGDGRFARQESLDSGFRPPQWVIHEF